MRLPFRLAGRRNPRRYLKSRTGS